MNVWTAELILIRQLTAVAQQLVTQRLLAVSVTQYMANLTAQITHTMFQLLGQQKTATIGTNVTAAELTLTRELAQEVQQLV